MEDSPFSPGKDPAPRRILVLELCLFLALISPPFFESLPRLFHPLLEAGPEPSAQQVIQKAANPRPMTVLAQGLIAAALLLSRLPAPAASTELPVLGPFGRASPLFLTPLVFLLLLAGSLFWNLISKLIGNEAVLTGGVPAGNPPLLLAATAVAAFYEEVLYRWYGPQLATAVLPAGPKGTKAGKLLPEIPLVVVFALSHGYGGWPAVGNALAAGCILRLAAGYSGGPWVGFAAHLLYNLTQLSLLLKA